MYGITPILWALGTILGTYFLSPIIGPLGPIVGTVIGTVIYIVLRAHATFRCGFRFHMGDGGLLHHELRQMGWLVIPRMAALGALQLQLLLLDRLASGLGGSMVALNQFASNFESVIPGIVGIAIAQSAFSVLSQSAALNQFLRLKQQLKKGILFNLSLAIPLTLCLAAMAGVAAWLMHLKPPVSSMFIQALLIYCVAVPFESTNHIILRTFYAMKNTTIPAVSSAISCAIAVVSGTLLLPSLGVYALAIAYVIAQITQTALLGSALWLHIRWKSAEADGESIASAALVE
jgi:peptidoglycan biosynthesis protein MviN/MurJ (putative lipid II flippase)